MGVWPSAFGVPGIADIPDDLTCLYLVALHERRVERRPCSTLAVVSSERVVVEVQVRGDPPVAVVDADEIPGHPAAVEFRHDPVRDCDDLGAPWAHDVRALVASAARPRGSPTVRESHRGGVVGEHGECEVGILG